MDNLMVVFIFDSGRMGSCSYGDEVFKQMLQGEELIKNSHKMIISYGDLIPKEKYRFIDIEPYINKDEFCTINFSIEFLINNK